MAQYNAGAFFRCSIHFKCNMFISCVLYNNETKRIKTKIKCETIEISMMKTNFIAITKQRNIVSYWMRWIWWRQRWLNAFNLTSSSGGSGSSDNVDVSCLRPVMISFLRFYRTNIRMKFIFISFRLSLFVVVAKKKFVGSCKNQILWTL